MAIGSGRSRCSPIKNLSNGYTANIEISIENGKKKQKNELKDMFLNEAMSIFARHMNGAGPSEH